MLTQELKGPLNADQKRFLDHIRKDSNHLLTLINDVLDLSKIEAGRLRLQRERIDCSNVLYGLAHIMVSDTGIGIPHEEQESVFDKFHQVGATTTGQRESSGWWLNGGAGTRSIDFRALIMAG